ncbi:9678_t:CDS:2 [Dentiscutata heterogama]|uniref:9678_t:CDS:1 n=1 Tax=Dentiscutata heterogama TaxID=1316150 RepID=A0ACA9LNW8_9GLOM|nr:9678_t:CDS:2 [Dentiscutata heterogama]
MVIAPGPVTKLPVDHEPPSQNSHTPYWNDYERFHDNSKRTKLGGNQTVTSPKSIRMNHNGGLQRMNKIGNCGIKGTSAGPGVTTSKR